MNLFVKICCIPCIVGVLSLYMFSCSWTHHFNQCVCCCCCFRMSINYLRVSESLQLICLWRGTYQANEGPFFLVHDLIMKIFHEQKQSLQYCLMANASELKFLHSGLHIPTSLKTCKLVCLPLCLQMCTGKISLTHFCKVNVECVGCRGRIWISIIGNSNQIKCDTTFTSS